MSFVKAKWIKTFGLAAILLIAGWAGYAYYQSQIGQPTLYGDWQGQIRLNQTGQTLELRLRFIEGGRSNTGAVAGQLFIRGEPWSREEQTLNFVGGLYVDSSAASITVVAESAAAQAGASRPSIVLNAKWEGDRLVEGLVSLDVPSTQDTLMGQWQARKVSR